MSNEQPFNLGACLVDGKLHATVMRRDPGDHITVVATAEIDESMLRGAGCHAVMQAAPDDYCPNCRGAGTETVMTSHLGPDDYEHEVTCSHCDGVGSLEAAYNGVVKLLEKERAESLKLSGKLYGLRHIQERRDAFLLEVGEDMARWHDPIGYWKDYTARAAAAKTDATRDAVLHACDEALAAVPDDKPIKNEWDHGFRDGLKCAITVVRAALHKR